MKPNRRGMNSDSVLSSLKKVKYTPNTMQTFTPDIVQIDKNLWCGLGNYFA